ncbi:MAG: hypothetical protein ABI912_03310 [Actinomycetota bacterium]
MTSSAAVSNKTSVAALNGTSTAAVVSPSANLYAGPLYVPVTDPGNPDVRVRAGAAAGALECSGAPYLGESNASDGGDDSQSALEDFLTSPGFRLPRSGYRVEREEPGRVLFSYDVAGKTKVAIVVSDAERPGFERGWHVESFADCNPAEWPEAVSAEVGVQVWTDANGDRVPTTIIESSQGPEHCNWQTATFLYLDKQSFIRDPEGVLSGTKFRTTFDPDTTLPADATNTGYRLGDRALWLAVDKTAAYVVTGNKVERWPAPTEQVGCA